MLVCHKLLSSLYKNILERNVKFWGISSFCIKNIPTIFFTRLFPTYIYTLRVIFNKENTAIWHTHVHVCFNLHDICTRKINFSTVKLFFHYFDQTRVFTKVWMKINNFYSNLMVPLCVYFCRPPSFSCRTRAKKRKNCTRSLRVISL